MCPQTHTDVEPELVPPRGPLLTVKQAASYLTLSDRYIVLKIASGDLPSVKFGRSRRVFKADLDDLIDAGTQR